jgi:hypothetical protein
VIVATAAAASSAGAASTSNKPIGASGSIAALAGSSMEVQNPRTGQTTVNWTSTTQFSKTVTDAVSSVTVGDCVTATGTPSKNPKTTIAVRTINLTSASSSGSCTRNGGSFGARSPGRPATGGPQFRPGEGGGGFPVRAGSSGNPPRNFGGAFRSRFGNFAIASGEVTGVNGSTLTVSGISISPGTFGDRTSKGSKNSKSSKHPTTPKTQTLKLTTSSSTTVNATQTAASTDLAVGDCVSAFGPAASNGAVTADTVRITSTGGASCTGGFAGGGGPGFFGGRGPGGGSGGGGA